MAIKSEVPGALLYIELGSVSFKASLIPKDEAGKLVLDAEAGFPERKLRNLLSLSAYRQKPLAKSSRSAMVKWIEQSVPEWSRQSISPANEVLVVATAVMRDVDFFEELQQAVRRSFRTRIHVLDGLIEAQLLINGYRSFLKAEASVTLFDLGGGSLEIVSMQRGSTQFASLQLGSGRVTAWLLDGIPLAEIRERISSELARCNTTTSSASHLWHGTGGAVRSFFKAFGKAKDEPIRDHEIASEMTRLQKRLLDERGCLKSKLSDDLERIAKEAPKDLRPERKYIYAGGITVLHMLCSYLDVTAIRLDRASVRSGVLTLLKLLRPTPFA